MFCEKCGSFVTSDIKVCGDCGNKVVPNIELASEDVFFATPRFSTNGAIVRVRPKDRDALAGDYKSYPKESSALSYGSRTQAARPEDKKGGAKADKKPAKKSSKKTA